LPLKSKEDCEEYTAAIFEQIYNAIELNNFTSNVQINRCCTLDLKNFQLPPQTMDLAPNQSKPEDLISFDVTKIPSFSFSTAKTGILFSCVDKLSAYNNEPTTSLQLRRTNSSQSFNQPKFSGDDSGQKSSLHLQTPTISLQHSKSDNLFKKSPINKTPSPKNKISSSPSAQILGRLTSSGGRFLKNILDNSNYNYFAAKSQQNDDEDLIRKVDSITRNLQDRRDAVFGKFSDRIANSKTRFVLL